MHPLPRHAATFSARPSTGWLLALALTFSPAVTRGATSLQLGITSPNAANGFKRTAFLTWNAQTGCVYTVQSSTTLGDASQWVAEESILATTSTLQWTAPSPIVDRKFYRVLLPSPQISAVEPAVVAPGVAANFYITGQCFDTNLVLRINGVVQGNVVFTDSGLISTSFTPPVAGTYLFEILVGGQVASSFTVVCADALANPELVLQGPPMEPPASPSAFWLSRKGYQYYMARSALAAAVPGKDSLETDLSPRLLQGGSLSGPPERGGGGIRENDNALFDVQEGKKGLNAVNVKLARMIGGGGDESEDDGTSIVSAAGNGRVEDFRYAVGHKRVVGGGNTWVVPFSGEVQASAVDLAIPGRNLDFVWARTYHSRLGRFDLNSNGWTFSYDVRCVQNSSGGIDVYDGTGRKDTFALQANGTYTCPQFFREGTLTSNVFRLTFADTGYWEFNPLGTTAVAGKLARIVDRNGNTMSLNYDGLGRLAQVVDDLGRTNTVSYDSDGRVAGVTDFSDRTVTYQYYSGLPADPGGSAGDLKSVTSPSVTGTPNGNDFPTGKTTTYTYSTGYLDDRENHLLLSVKDAQGQIKHQHVYQHNESSLEFLRCISVQHWTNTPTVLSYLPQTPTPANQFATMRCIVNGPVGDVMECFYDARNRPLKMQEFTGRATPGAPVTATVNRPMGKVRADDPDTYETRWSWNQDSLCTLEIGPGGQQTQCVYESDFDKSTRARKRADCRVVREIASSPVDLDGDGAADVTERLWRYEYDPRFGSDPTANRGKKLYVGNLPFFNGDPSMERLHSPGQAHWGNARLRSGVIAEVGAGRPATVGRLRSGVIAEVGHGKAPNKAPNVTHEYHRFATSITDPRGNVATASYDAKGNSTQWEPHKSPGLDSPQLEFTYNAHGEVTSITNAADANGRRSVDTFAYAQGQVVQCVEDAGAGGLALTTAFEYDARGNLTRCVDPRGNDWLCTYNSLDQLVQTESAALVGGSPTPYRIKTQYSYDANDNLTLVAEENRDAAGTPGTNAFWRTQFVYDGGQRLTGCWRDKNGALVLRCTEVQYNAANQVVLYRSPEAVNGNDPANTVAFAYDERGLAYRTTAAPGTADQSTTQCDYDPNGLVTRVSEGLEDMPGITTMEYDGFAGFGSTSCQSQAREARFEEKVRTENVSSRLRSGVSSLQFEHGYINSPIVIGSMWGSQRAKGNTSIGAAYLGINRRSKITDPLGNVTTFHYDANDNLKVASDFGQMNDVLGSTDNIRLAESRYEYDGLDRPIRSRDSFFSLPSQAPIGDGERTTTFAYAPNGECTSVTDDLGRATAFGYDTAGRHLSTTTAEAKTITAVFRDAAGNVTQTTQTEQPDLGGPPQVFVWTNVYDALNRPVSTSDNVGNTNQFAYDSRGNCTSATDPNGNETVYGYDGLSRTVQHAVYQGQESSGIVTSSGQFAYDDNDRTTSSTDANGNVTLHAYDSQDRLTQTTQADGTHHTLVWSPRSNLIQETDANGTVINHTYDLNDRCISNNITPGGGVATTTTFETFAYNGRSQLVAATNDAAQNAFEYDSMGNRTRGVSGGLGAVVTPHDSVGNRLSMTYPGGRVLTYAYDALDQRTSINEDGAPLASFSYAGPGRVARVICGNGTITQVTYDGLSGTPNDQDDFGQGMISSVTHAVPGTTGPQSFAAVNLKWDRNGNKTLRSDTIFAPAIPRTNTLGLQYDAADRLTRATVISDLTVVRDTVYGLDAMGNRTNVTGAASCSGSYFMDGLVPGPLDAQMNQYTATPCDTRSYDDNGNLVGRSLPGSGPVTYQYDYAGRLVLLQSVDLSSGSAVISTSTYAYDALGRRIAKTVSSGSLPSVTTAFIYDGDAVIEEKNGAVTTATYVRSRCFGAGQPAHKETCDSMRRGGQDYFYHTDDQGNVLALSTTGGAVVERYDYDDYGKVTFLTSDGVATSATSSSVGNVYCWGGLRLDAETGLHNNDGGGYLEPQSGRAVRGKVKSIRDMGSGFAGPNNPWTGGPPIEMKKGTVKFFNETKGFGKAGGSASGGTKNPYITIP